MEEPQKPFWWPDPQSFIAVVLVLAMVALVFVLVLRGTVPESDMLKMVVGGLMTTGFATIISFYFGSSKGSKEKDEALITKATNGTTPPAAPVSTTTTVTDAATVTKTEPAI